MAKQIPTRDQIEEQYTWNFADLYPSVDAWKQDLEKAAQLADKAAGYQGMLGSAQALLEYCTTEEEISEILRRAEGYASCMRDVDTTNSANQALVAQVTSIVVDCSGKLAFSTPEIMAIEEDALQVMYAQQPALERYRRSIADSRRMKEHVLSAAEERLLAAAGEMAEAPSTIHSMMDNADLTFPSVKDSKGEEFQVTNGSYISLMESPDRALRKAAFESLYHTYASMKNTSASALAAQVNQLKFYAKARKYNSTLEASLDATNVPVEVYHNLIQAVNEDLPYLHKYMELRKKLLGVDELHMYDLYASMVPEADVKVTFEQAKENVMDAVAVLGKEYQAILKEGFENRWLDVYENQGKRSGAYSAGHRVHPFVLLNHKETLNSEFTLAHEMGHAIHSYLSNRTQTPVDANYVIFVAEVASTCNEALLMQSLLKKTTDKKVRATLINYFLEQFRTTLYRQTMFAEFEMLINRASEQGEALTSEMMNKLYHELNVKYYGPAVVVDEEIDYEWERIPHFYYNFYVFQYATGFSAAMALSERILKEGDPAVKDYLGFLSGGCSKDPISLLQGAGVDMRTPKPIHDALALFNSLIDELDALLSE